ncbi:unnamed protein product [Larinioides sclopetarius]|uniref:Flavin-containing monooxygenase n=1 Tax=Larinioides sclopetarius TaxID=280406 RepID=A0AAV2BQB3_9ARAC
MQCRFASQVVSGKCKLPSKESMMEDIRKRHEEILQRYTPSDKMSIRVDYIEYMDEIATEMGCKPNLWKILVTDPKLFWALIFGPSLSYQYRLEGPHKWKGARNAILTAPERVRYPLSRGYIQSTKNSLGIKPYWKYVSIFLLMAFRLIQSKMSLKGYLCALALSLSALHKTIGIRMPLEEEILGPDYIDHCLKHDGNSQIIKSFKVPLKPISHSTTYLHQAYTVPLKNRFFVADINGDWSAHSFGRTEPTEDEGKWPIVLTALYEKSWAVDCDGHYVSD